jgi:hypothetical protein
MPIPFGTFNWRRENGGWTWDLDLTTGPAVELRQIGRETFVIRKSFCYLVAEEPDAGAVYVIRAKMGRPGAKQ